MQGKSADFSSVDAYIASFPHEIQVILESVRATIRAAAPDAEERISYQMPAFALNGNLVYYAARKRHIGLYPTSSGIAAFEDELSRYDTTKGSVKFPIDEPLPMDLISRIVRFRVAENRQKATANARKTDI